MAWVNTEAIYMVLKTYWGKSRSDCPQPTQNKSIEISGIKQHNNAGIRFLSAINKIVHKTETASPKIKKVPFINANKPKGARMSTRGTCRLELSLCSNISLELAAKPASSG